METGVLSNTLNEMPELTPQQEILKEVNEEKAKELDEIKLILGEIHEKIMFILREYCDLNEDYYPLISTWIIGTYIYEAFDTYPYMFINAMRGSGKTRLMKLITALSHNGSLVTNLTEAVLFRTARGKTLCIDEFEGVNSKEKTGLRELLNACYKKGIKIMRMKKRRTAEGEDHVVEEFEPYTPIVMANIWGMEEVLGDRCIPLILEKSSDKLRTKLMEDFDENILVKSVKQSFEDILVQLCSYFGEKGYKKEWNKFIKDKYIKTTHTTHTTYYTPLSEQTGFAQPNNWCSYGVVLDIFNKIDATEINGRDLELIFPLLMIADFLGGDLFNDTLKICKRITKLKKEEEMIESRDVSLLDYVSQQLEGGFISVKKLTNGFRDFSDDDDADDKWLNTKWVGRCLKRLDLIVEKRRMRGGMELRINIPKAIRKIEMFRGKLTSDAK